ncbi:MAG: cation:proton antiporter [Thermoflexibacter sp.]
MVLLSTFDWTLPLKNPVLIFSLILFIILFAPIILNKFKIPHLIGLIIAGAIIGTNGLNLMRRDSSIILFGTVGLLYIMFLAGLEIDLADFKKNSRKSIIFGLYTFLIPMTLGTLSGLYLLQFSLPTSILLASMFASHTLIAYPIVSKLGVTKNKAVNITVGGTVITDTLALLVLAVIVGMSTGEITNEFWIKLGISILAFVLTVMFGFPIIGRWFFKRFDDHISQYIFVLGMVFLGAFLAEAAGIEAIIGAFLAGLALNRLIPRTSPLMNRIEFVGNALFIPFFLIGVGMLIDYKAFFKDFETIKVAVVMTSVATLSKFCAAWLTQKTFRFSIDERRLIFGLSNAQAAATLAAVLVGYNIVLGQTDSGEPIRLLNESVLNGTILMILITCTIATFVAQKGAQNIAAMEATNEEVDESEEEEKILISIHNPETIEELMNLSIMVKSKKNKTGLYALNIISSENSDEVAYKKAKKMLDKAIEIASSTDNQLNDLVRYDLNVVNGITNTVKEHKITDLILGLHKKIGISDSFLGNLTEGILTKCNANTLIYKPLQPLATIKKHVIIVPKMAEKELGFYAWLSKVWNIGRNTGAKLVFYATEQTLHAIKEVHKKHHIEAEFKEFSDWEDFLVLSRDIKSDDNLIIVMSRKNHPSYDDNMPKIPKYLNKYFQTNNFMLIFPTQIGVSEETVIDDFKNPSVLEPIKENIGRLDSIGKTISGLFKRKKQ